LSLSFREPKRRSTAFLRPVALLNPIRHACRGLAQNVRSCVKRANFPVMQPMQFEPASNLITTKYTLRLAVPRSILARADKAIE
jgi:hypothetical protein